MMPGRKVQRDRTASFNPFVSFQWVNRFTLPRMSVGPLSPSITRAVLSSELAKTVGFVRAIEVAWKNRVGVAPLPSDGVGQLGACIKSSVELPFRKDRCCDLVVASGLETMVKIFSKPGPPERNDLKGSRLKTDGR
jgi:hypothetical protein